MNSYKLLQEAAEHYDYEVRSYSGRGMYGKDCVGIVTDDSFGTVILNIWEYCRNFHKLNENVSDLIQSLKNNRQDNMGLESVYYFPRMKWENYQAGIDAVDDDENDE